MQVPDKHMAEKALRKMVQPWSRFRDFFEVTSDKGLIWNQIKQEFN